MKNKNKHFALVLAIAVAMTTACATENNSGVNSEGSSVEVTTESKSETESNPDDDKKPVQQGNDLKLDGYNIVFEDNFDGTELDRTSWNVELHEPGWVNAEWQEYVDSKDNIFIEDGKLVIRPIKTKGEDGKDYYTSGRISTQNKKDFTYGVFEARLKVPKGVGYLPAFWLMATDENVYGQWPRCGEVDIMEVHGSEPTTTYATLHYGNPHAQSQGKKTLTEGSFADDFHTFTVEWNPGEIKWFVDGYLVHTENEWFSVTEGQGEITYPAPFDQPFYMILNLAVGGSWVGYPDETTDFENARYEVDYVKVYQKDSYDENVEKPNKEVDYKEPDADGNYITNGNCADNESLEDEEGWKFLLTQGGEATATVENNQMNIIVDKSGSVDYSVQLVQPGLPMFKGGRYEITFDAYSTGDRTMLVGISAPDLNFIRYFPDTVAELTTEKKSYRYEFTMEADDDDNGRLEFNMGNVASTDDIFITNVAVKLLEKGEIGTDNSKSVLADGNYIYNGKFQEGEKHIGFWEIPADTTAKIFVTDFYDGRRLSLDLSEQLTLAQSGLALGTGAYYFSAEIEGEKGKTVTVNIGGEAFDIVLDGGKKVYSKNFSLSTVTDKTATVTFNDSGKYYIDNVTLTEDSLLKNGSFNAGLAGFEPYAYTVNDVKWVVDSLAEDNAVDFTINSTGTEAWHIQLKQNGIKLVKGQKYRLSFDAKSSLDRKIMFAIQRDGSKHGDDWTPYSGESIVSIGAEYTHQVLEFEMEFDSDSESVFSLSMGAVDGTKIDTQHRICIDNILLETIE